MSARERLAENAARLAAWPASTIAYMIEEGFLREWPFEITRAGWHWINATGGRPTWDKS